MPNSKPNFYTTYNQPITLASTGRRQFHCRFVRAGKILNSQRKPTKYTIKPQALESAAAEGLFNHKAVFIDHAGMWDNPSLKNLAGTTLNATYNTIEQTIEGTIKLSNTPTGKAIADLLDELLEDGEEAPDIGLSLVFYPTWDGNEITAIQHVESVDLVFQPAADGRILQALSAIQESNPIEVITMSETREPYVTQPPEPTIPPIDQSTNPLPNDMEEWRKLQAMYAARQEDMAILAARQVIQTSGLPLAAQQRLLDRKYATAQEVSDAIESERAYLAALTEQNVVN